MTKEMQFFEKIREDYKEATLILVHWRTYRPKKELIEKGVLFVKENPQEFAYGQLMAGPNTWVIFNLKNVDRLKIKGAFWGLDDQAWVVEMLE